MTNTVVTIPASPAEAVAAFGDGTDVTVVAGGTIAMPAMARGQLSAPTTILLHEAGLAGVTRSSGRVTIGATTPIADLLGLPAPLGPCAANVADSEIRAQATLGGNLCASPGTEAPRGDLQGALLALGADVRSTGAGGEVTEPVEAFLARGDNRLVLDISFDEPAAGAFAPLSRAHTHAYTTIAVSAVRGKDGAVRLAATGAAPKGIRLPSAEAKAADPQAAGIAAVTDAQPFDDALATAWYRARVLPTLVRRALTTIQEDA